MLEGRTEYEHEREGIPDWHRLAQNSSKPWRYLNVSAISQLTQLRMNESGNSEFVACHQPCYGNGCYVVSNGHRNSMRYGARRCSTITVHVVK